jgi:hypothetical protein
MTLAILNYPLFRATDANGAPLAGGRLWSYLAGTSTPIALLAADGTSSLTNPVVLDANGQAAIRLPSPAVKLDLYSSVATGSVQQPLWPIDNVTLLTPALFAGYSATLSQMQVTTDPGELGTESLATSLAGELERLRYALKEAKSAYDPHVSRWYETPYAASWYNVKSYGALGDASHDDTTAIQAALTAVNTRGGGTVFLPKGFYKTTAPLIIYPHTTLRGEGRKISVIHTAHNGDGLQSTHTINTNTAVCLRLEDFGLDNYPLGGGTATGGGFVDVGGSFIELRNVYVRSFLQNVILDGSEHVLITGCEFICDGPTEVNVWMTNGPDHTLGYTTGFTNVVTITDCQFNATTGTHIRDDGGANHNIVHNNFNAATTGIRAANTSSLRLEGNFFESQTTNPVLLATTTELGGVTVYPHHAPVIRANSFSTPGAPADYHIDVLNALGGAITDNVFVGTTGLVAMIHLSTDLIQGILIEGNTKSLVSTDRPFVSANAPRLSAQRYRQRLFTTVGAAAVGGGSVVVTPKDMGFTGTLERPKVFERVLVQSPDLSVSEIAPVTAVGTTTLTLTLAHSYPDDFALFGLGDTSTVQPVGADLENGTGSIATGAGPWNTTLTHGLGYTPLPADINLTVTAASTLPTGLVWINNIGINTFRVNIEADPGAAGFTFAWRINPAPYRY